MNLINRQLLLQIAPLRWILGRKNTLARPYPLYLALTATIFSAEIIRLARHTLNYHTYQLTLAFHILSGSLLTIFFIKRMIQTAYSMSHQLQKPKPLPLTFNLVLTLLILTGLLRTFQLRTNLSLPSWVAPLHGALAPYIWLLVLLLFKQFWSKSKKSHLK